MTQKNIILIEDENTIAETILFSLNKEGYNPFHASSITEAKKLFQEYQNFDLAILDIGLPDGSGLDYCKEIRKYNNIPIFFLTAKSDEIDRILGLEMGADDYITKPFSPRELIARVRSLFRRLKSVNEIRDIEQLNIGYFKILKDYYQIFYRDQLLELSRYEFGILKELVTSKGRILSRQQIMERVWENPEMSLERTIDAHIKSLRKKLKIIEPSEVIITHRGIGYAISMDQV